MQFWAAWPKKKKRPNAAAAFAKHHVTPELLATILAAVSTEKRSNQWLKNKGEYIPFPATWLNNRQWEDCEAESTSVTRPRDPNAKPFDPIKAAPPMDF